MFIQHTLTSLFKNTKKTLFILALLWLLMQLGIWYKYGAIVSVDSVQYLEAAKSLTRGELPQGRYIWYSSYCLFLAIFSGIHNSHTWIVIFQILISGIAAFSLFNLTKEITNSNIVAFLSVLFFILWIKIQQWNVILYTESLYTSISIITFYLFVRVKSKTGLIPALAMFVFTFFIRPTGYCFLVALLAYGLSHYPVQNLTTAFKRLGVLIALLTCLWLLNVMMHFYNPIQSYSKAEIIYPNITMGLYPPSDLTMPDATLPPLFQLMEFTILNPIYFVELTGLKLFLFIGNVKPYFSWLHNSLIITILYPLYILAFIGFRSFPHDRKEKVFILIYILMQAIVISLTTENWDGRFLIPLLPFIFILSAIGLSSVMARYKLAKH